MTKKKIIVAMLGLMLVLLMCACGDSDKSSSDNSDNGGGAPVEKKADDSDEAEEPKESSDDSDKEKSGEEKGTHKVKTSKDGKLKILDKGYSYDDGYVTAAIIIADYNSEDAYESPSVTVTAYGDDDSVLGTTDTGLSYIGPGDVQALSTEFDTGGKKPAKVDFSLNEGSEAEIDDDVVPGYDFVCSGINEREDKEMDEMTVTGSVENKSKKDVEEVELTIIMKKGDKIVFSDTNYVENVKSNNKRPFEFSSLYDVPDHDDVQIYAYDNSI